MKKNNWVINLFGRIWIIISTVFVIRIFNVVIIILNLNFRHDLHFTQFELLVNFRSKLGFHLNFLNWRGIKFYWLSGLSSNGIDILSINIPPQLEDSCCYRSRFPSNGLADKSHPLWPKHKLIHLSFLIVNLQSQVSNFTKSIEFFFNKENN